MKEILKVHMDVMTVPEVINELLNEFSKTGYQVEKITPINFKIIFPDGWVHVFWEKGCIYQEIFEEAIA